VLLRMERKRVVALTVSYGQHPGHRSPRRSHAGPSRMVVRSNMSSVRYHR